MKNSTSFLFFGILILMNLTACSQEKELDCAAILSKQPYIFREYQQVTMNIDSVNNDYSILQKCGNLDSIDGIIFQGPLIGQLLITKLNNEGNNHEVTYQSLIDMISEFKTDNADHYQKMRSGTIVRLEIEKMPVELGKFESIRSKLMTAGLTNEEINKFKSFLDTNNKTWNYKQAMAAFMQSQRSNASIKPLDFPRLQTLEKLLTNAKAKNTNCLIYFSCYSCVNARKFENQALTTPEIQELIQKNFIYEVAYTDDRQKLPDETKTIGETHTQLQKQKFNSVYQPVLYILSPDGKIIASWSYENGIGSFRDFLKKGIKK